MRIKRILVIVLIYCFAIIGTQPSGRSILFWVTSRFSYIPTMTSLKGQITISYATRRFDKGMKAELGDLSYMLFLLELGILAVAYF